jgi:hypothetical protein
MNIARPTASELGHYGLARGILNIRQDHERAFLSESATPWRVRCRWRLP